MFIFTVRCVESHRALGDVHVTERKNGLGAFTSIAPHCISRVTCAVAPVGIEWFHGEVQRAVSDAVSWIAHSKNFRHGLWNTTFFEEYHLNMMPQDFDERNFL
ncbi:hypothetical protein BV898_02569 [Hypsibius exemplaris]|uniref:Uncharacterized protein n=1 Tax=Hypsibius exemplaris TaxID=2072580 RepID=A0A1W0X7E0_HYPEX|nr:hypothetical protein BV898_02569 [Hypsibius exemplaris]